MSTASEIYNLIFAHIHLHTRIKCVDRVDSDVIIEEYVRIIEGIEKAVILK